MVINLVANENRNYSEILRTKLLWGREHNFGQQSDNGELTVDR